MSNRETMREIGMRVGIAGIALGAGAAGVQGALAQPAGVRGDYLLSQTLNGEQTVNSCVEEALGITEADRTGLNPAEFVGSSYPVINGRTSLGRITFRALGSNISEDCRDIVTSRETFVQQIYGGRPNSARVRFSSPSRYDTRKTVGLRRSYISNIPCFTVRATTTLGFDTGEHASVSGSKRVC